MNITEKNILKLTKKILTENVDVSCLKENKLKLKPAKTKTLPGGKIVSVEAEYYAGKDRITGQKIRFYLNGTLKKINKDSTPPHKYKKGEWSCKKKDIYITKMDPTQYMETID